MVKRLKLNFRMFLEKIPACRETKREKLEEKGRALWMHPPLLTPSWTGLNYKFTHDVLKLFNYAVRLNAFRAFFVMENRDLNKIYIYFFLSGFSFTDTDDSQGSRGREGTIFYSTLPLPPAHEHWDIYLQLCMWDDYHVFLIATLVFNRLLLHEIYHLIELPFDWLINIFDISNWYIKY